MNATARVCIVMPVFNGRRFIEAAIESILKQTMTNWELTVVDDGSTDGTASIVAAVSDPRIRVIRQTSNRGPELSRRDGSRSSGAKYIARMDADDVMHPRRLEVQLDFLETHPEIVAVGGQIEYLSEDGRHAAFRSSFPLDHDSIVSRFCRMRGALCNPTLMVRATADALVPYPKYGGPGADVAYILGLARVGRLANLEDLVHYMRVHAGSIQSSRTPAARLARNRHAVAVFQATTSDREPPDWETFQRECVLSGQERIAEMREVALSKYSRRLMWQRLNGGSFRQILPPAVIVCALAPARTVKRVALWIKDRRG